MSEVITELLSSIGVEVVDDDALAKEAHRLYLAHKVETTEENLKILREACRLAVEERQYMHSPFMLGYVEGLRKATAFVQGLQIQNLPRPTVWYNDPSFKTRYRAMHYIRRQVRRDLTRVLYHNMAITYDYNQNPVNLPDGYIERLVRVQLRLAMRAYTPMYKVRIKLKRRIEATGVKYEEVTNAKNVESWWS